MNTASINELRSELRRLSPDEVMDLCIRLIKFKKENKELLSYLLFESDDEKSFIESVCTEVDSLFAEINRRNTAQAKKSVLKIARLISKYSKYSGNKRTEVELLLYFCKKLRSWPMPRSKNNVFEKIYFRQFMRLRKMIEALHPDLQYDYEEDLVKLVL